MRPTKRIAILFPAVDGHHRLLILLITSERLFHLTLGAEFLPHHERRLQMTTCMLNVMLKHEPSMSRLEMNLGHFIDRIQLIFNILNYLRNGIVDLPPEKFKLNAILREAEFYQINGLYTAVQKYRRRRARITREGLLTMINTRGSSEFMLPNTDFSGEDLSHLSLTKGMFMNVDFRSVLLGKCCFIPDCLFLFIIAIASCRRLFFLLTPNCLCAYVSSYLYTHTPLLDSEADMRFSDFERTRFSGSLFRSANLSNAVLTEAQLDGADLTGANLQKTQLYKADLKNARLRGCDLMWANLQQACLVGVDLRGAMMQGVILHGRFAQLQFGG